MSGAYTEARELYRAREHLNRALGPLSAAYGRLYLSQGVKGSELLALADGVGAELTMVQSTMQLLNCKIEQLRPYFLPWEPVDFQHEPWQGDLFDATAWCEGLGLDFNPGAGDQCPSCREDTMQIHAEATARLGRSVVRCPRCDFGWKRQSKEASVG